MTISRYTALRVGLFFACLHTVLIAAFLIAFGFSLGGQVRLLWTLWIPLDFPVSLLVDLGFEFIPKSTSASQVIRTWWPIIVHCILGTIWWFIVPFFLVRRYERRKRKFSVSPKSE